MHTFISMENIFRSIRAMLNIKKEKQTNKQTVKIREM